MSREGNGAGAAAGAPRAAEGVVGAQSGEKKSHEGPSHSLQLDQALFPRNNWQGKRKWLHVTPLEF